MSIKWKIFYFLILFCTILIFILWLSQVVFMNYFYKQIKTIEVKNFGANLTSNFKETSDIDNLIEKAKTKDDISVYIYSLSDKKFYSNVKASLSESDFLVIYSQTLSSGGNLTETFKTNTKDSLNNTEGNENLFYSHIKVIDDKKYLIVATSVITPVNSIMSTIKVQLIFIMIVMLISSVIIALIISKIVSSPIEKINRNAKNLITGDFNWESKGITYKEIVELSETLSIVSKELTKNEKLRREFIANVSHDLKTPLTLIIGYGETMRDLPNENTPENIEIIINEAKRLNALVNDSLEISKLEAEVYKLNISYFNLTNLINENIDRINKLIQNNKCAIFFNYDKEIFINADAGKIAQTLYNLILNAIYHTGEDKKIIVNQIIDKTSVRIEVTDNGEGIPLEIQKCIWDRYYKVNNKRQLSGSGLGLSIVKKIIEMHNGEYGVISNEGIGSTFYFKLRLD